jgi:hypothetical protein
MRMMAPFMFIPDQDASKVTRMPATTSVTCFTYHYYHGNINYLFQIHDITYAIVNVESSMVCMTSQCAALLTT